MHGRVKLYNPQPVGADADVDADVDADADADVDSLIPLDGRLPLQHSHDLWSLLFPAPSHGGGHPCSLCYGFYHSRRSGLKLGSLLCSFHCKERSAAFSDKGTSHPEIGDASESNGGDVVRTRGE